MTIILNYNPDTCPHRRSMGGYDSRRDKTYEAPDLCDINDKICLLETGDKCEIYEEFLSEQ